MAQRAIKRIQKDLKDIHESTDTLKENGIYVYYNEENIKELYAMFVGREKTPYHHGFYFIRFTFPDDYPMSPPKAVYCTQGTLPGCGSVRFNPNLYTCGKVCLSMLNTWSGPGWVPTNTITNVFMAIQALVLNEAPLQNEPGYSNLAVSDPSIQAYNRLIEYANYKIAMLEMMMKPPRGFEMFVSTMREYFVSHYVSIVAHVIQLRDSARDIHSNAYGGNHIIKPDYEMILGKMAEYYQLFTTV